MDLPEPKLFVGLPFDQELSFFLEQLSPEAYALYFHSYDSYLHVQSSNGRSYIGKEVPFPLSIEQLAHIEKNIFSILKKVIPEYPIGQNALKVIGYLE